ncbi:hypothetical protein AX17_005075 [Amanita inopinata Kibby_2008]|nr:hypothetical protein AX17_005075 [Amanita inopinata Kibby_2008]
MKLRKAFFSLGYRVSDTDLSLFFKFNKNPGEYTIVAVATDDLTIIADSVKSAELIKEQLNKHFELVDLGEIKWLLGVHLTRNHGDHTISLGQQSYIDEVIARFGLQDT